MSTTYLPVFEQLTRLLHPLNPAELHGLLCGLLCTDRRLNPDQWLHHVSEQQGDLPESARTVLVKLWEYGTAQLLDDDEGCALPTPLLPDDDAPLTQRADAVGAWCQGFLYGLGLGKMEQRGNLSTESQEFLRDATDIAQVGFDTDKATDADETAYMEVVEYLRVGLVLIQQDLSHLSVPENTRLH